MWGVTKVFQPIVTDQHEREQVFVPGINAVARTATKFVTPHPYRLDVANFKIEPIDRA